MGIKGKKKPIKTKKIFGPGFITGMSDNDPSGIATYSQSGAHFGYSQLWLSIYTLPLLIVVQEMCARISLVSKKGIITLLRENYHKSLVYFTSIILLIANSINIGADLNAMAECSNALINIHFYFYLLFFSIITILLMIFLNYKKYSKILVFFSIFLMAYIFIPFVTKQDMTLIIKNFFIPNIQMNKDFLLNLVAIIGTTISPYMFFWQPEQTLEEIKLKHKTQKVKPTDLKDEMKGMREDTISGMSISNIFMFFIIIVTAATLHANGIMNVESADQAAKALEPILGTYAFLIFSIGIISQGLLSIPILAGSSAYVCAEALRKKKGLDNKFSEAKFFYITIILAVLIGFIVNLTSLKPFKMLYYSAAINGILTPILIFVIMLIANNKKIMKRKSNGTFANVLSSLLIILTSISIVLFFVFLFK